MEYYNHYNKKCYVSFSGGKDSTVLVWLCAKVCELFNCNLTLWFSDTGFEFPEIREHVKSYEDWLRKQFKVEIQTIIDTPKDKEGNRILFKDVVLNEGYPILSKLWSEMVYKGLKNYRFRCGFSGAGYIREIDTSKKWRIKYNQVDAPIIDYVDINVNQYGYVSMVSK